MKGKVLKINYEMLNLVQGHDKNWLIMSCGGCCLDKVVGLTTVMYNDCSCKSLPHE